MWNVDPLGYQPDHPLYEVLCDVGDMRSGRSYTSQIPTPTYVVTFLSQEGPSRPPSDAVVRLDRGACGFHGPRAEFQVRSHTLATERRAKIIVELMTP
jgi:hypothetical protein